MTGRANTHYSALAAWPDVRPSPQPDIGVPLSSRADLGKCCFCTELPPYKRGLTHVRKALRASVRYIYDTTYKTGGILLAPPPVLFFFLFLRFSLSFFSTSILLHSSFVFFPQYPLLAIV